MCGCAVLARIACLMCSEEGGGGDGVGVLIVSRSDVSDRPARF